MICETTVNAKYVQLTAHKENLIYPVAILADYRERHVFENLINCKIPVFTTHLTSGDYVIAKNFNKVSFHYEPLVLIERKTLIDYAQSIKDGRHKNRFRLQEVAIKLNCKFAFIIEGINNKSSYDGITYETIMGSVMRLQFDGFVVFYSNNKDGTVNTLADISKNSLVYSNKHPERIGGFHSIEECNQLLKAPVKLTPTEIKFQCLCGISSIGKEHAKALMPYKIIDLLIGSVKINDIKLENGKTVSNEAIKAFTTLNNETTIELMKTYPRTGGKTMPKLIVQMRQYKLNYTNNYLNLPTNKKLIAIKNEYSGKLFSDIIAMFEL